MGLAGFAGACSASNTQRDVLSSPEQVSGCFQLELYPDELGPVAEKERAEWNIPEYVVLGSDPLTTWPSLTQQYGTVFVATSVTADGQTRDHPFNYWRFTTGDSLYVGHPGALAGVSLALHIEGQDLRGEIASFTDVRVEGRSSAVTAPVRAKRVECPSDRR